MPFEIRPITLREANRFVAAHHRHHRPPRGHRWSLACYDGDTLRGVAICGRPLARHLDDGLTNEVLRLCTDGTRNACSFLLGAVRRAALALGYRRTLTYTLMAEEGASLRGAGWEQTATTDARSWNRPKRARADLHPVGLKRRWEAPS